MTYRSFGWIDSSDMPAPAIRGKPVSIVTPDPPRHTVADPLFTMMTVDTTWYGFEAGWVMTCSAVSATATWSVTIIRYLRAGGTPTPGQAVTTRRALRATGT